MIRAEKVHAILTDLAKNAIEYRRASSVCNRETPTNNGNDKIIAIAKMHCVSMDVPDIADIKIVSYPYMITGRSFFMYDCTDVCELGIASESPIYSITKMNVIDSKGKRASSIIENEDYLSYKFPSGISKIIEDNGIELAIVADVLVVYSNEEI